MEIYFLEKCKNCEKSIFFAMDKSMFSAIFCWNFSQSRSQTTGFNL